MRKKAGIFNQQFNDERGHPALTPDNPLTNRTMKFLTLMLVYWVMEILNTQCDKHLDLIVNFDD